MVTNECIKGIEFKYELLEKIPCIFNDGDMDFEGFLYSFIENNIIHGD